MLCFTTTANYPVESIGHPIYHLPKVQRHTHAFTMPITLWNEILVIRNVTKSFPSAAAANPDLPSRSRGNKPSMPRMYTFDRHRSWLRWKTVVIFSGNMNMNMIVFDVIYMNQVINIDIIIFFFISIYPINLAIKCNQQNKQCLLMW